MSRFIRYFLLNLQNPEQTNFSEVFFSRVWIWCLIFTSSGWMSSIWTYVFVKSKKLNRMVCLITVEFSSKLVLSKEHRTTIYLRTKQCLLSNGQFLSLWSYKSNSKRLSIFILIVRNRYFDVKVAPKSGYPNIAIIYFGFLASQR